MSTNPPTRECLPTIRGGLTRKFQVPHKLEDGTVTKFRFYITANTDDAGRLREIFIKADKQGGLASGALDSTAMMISIALQYGIPLKVITDKLRHSRFGPSGFTGDKEFPSCTSVFDLVAQFLDKRFGDAEPEDGIVR